LDDAGGGRATWPAVGGLSIHFSTAALVAAVAAAALGTAAQSVSGFGFSLVAAPVFVQLIGAPRAVRLANLIAVLVNLLVLARDRHGARPTVALRMLLPAIAVTPVVAYAVHRTDAAVLSIIVGLLVIASAVALASGRRWERLRGGGGMVLAGSLSAAMNTASGVGGPTVAMYALNAGWSVDMTRPTLQLYFLGLNALSFLALGGVTLPAADLGVLIAGILVGFAVGTTAARRLSAEAVGTAIIVLSVTGGLAAIARGAAHV
jgi:uncharacterized membrane protein YfcA